jgi:hypothetical protein
MKTLKIYSEGNIQRKIAFLPLQLGGEKPKMFYQEMDRRGVIKLKPMGMPYEGSLLPISQKTDENIKERSNREYAVENLSLLSLIESVLVEVQTDYIKIDLLKIEILLILFQKEEIFRYKERLFKDYKKASSITKAYDFFVILQSFLYDIGKMLVTECHHDFLINKGYVGELKMTPTNEFEEIFEYFADMEYYFLDGNFPDASEFKK